MRDVVVRARSVVVDAFDRWRREGAGWIVASAGAAGLAVGAVATGVHAAAVGDPGERPASATTIETIPPIVAGSFDTVTRIETLEEPLEPESITRTDKFVPVGYTKIVSSGDPGLQRALYSVTVVNGVETERELLAKLVVKEPTHDVVAVGALVVPSRPAIVPGSNRDIGKQLAAGYGWTGIEWQCLDNLFERESNWRHLIANPSSGAYGIPQALPGSKMASAGADWQTNPATQITWGLGYIKGRYGTPCVAWGKWTERSPHWY